MTNQEKLLEIIDKKSLTVSTDSLDISFGEISSMYEGKELEIRPAYQRLFRWSITQQSQFIESLLLGLPIPPIFVIETNARKYELIDGLQRVSTYLHFTGGLRKNKLKLINCDIVPELNNFTIDDISPALRIKIKRSYVKMYIIKKESPSRIKYDMFKRLNTGGSLLEAQEIRNSTIRFLGEKFIDFIQDLSKDENFKNCISYVQKYLLERQFDDELVLKFFTLKNGSLEKYRQEGAVTLADFLTRYAEQVASKEVSFDYEKEEGIFKKTFEVLNRTLGQQVFSTSSNPQFLAFYYESISMATASIIDKVGIWDEKQFVQLENNIVSLKDDPKFQLVIETKRIRRTKEYLPSFRRIMSIAKPYISKGF